MIYKKFRGEYKMENAKEYVAKIMEKSRKAQKVAECFSQEQADKLVAAIGWAGVNEENMKKIAEFGMEETQLGTYEGKYNKMSFKIRGIMRDMLGVKTVGIIEDNKETGITKIAKPLGVIGALVPCTNPCVTPFIKAMWAIKSRNSIVFSPHPRSKKTNKMVCEMMRDVLKKYGAPVDLILYVEEPTIEISNEIMRQCDTVVATGGGAMVHAAYTSGTPAYGVGTGNAIEIVDETADIKQYAADLRVSQMNDNSTGCSTENAIIVQERVYDEMVELLTNNDAFIVVGEDKTKLHKTLWKDGIINRNIVGQSACKIAKMAGINVPESCAFLVVPETDTSASCKFATEKLSPVLTLYKYKEFDDAVKMLNDIQSHCGAGHSCGIQSKNEEHIMQVMLETYTSRVMVEQATGIANAGSWANGMPVTATLGCGSWGGNSISRNVDHTCFYNTTWVSRRTKFSKPDDSVLFASVLAD
jgi:sulfoacetaldehyde dehydrogenase